MGNLKGVLKTGVIVALASQIYINLFTSDFNISFGLILFPVFLFLFRKLNPYQTGMISALFVYILRIFAFSVRYGEYSTALLAYLPELFSYVSYGIFYHFLNRKNIQTDLTKFFMNLIICDFFSNLIELYVRMQWKLFDSELSIVGMIFMIAIARTTIICIIIVALQYHKILILQQDHENRYRKLLWITSQLKTEMYWMEKNMDHIENVMSNAYSLFENISNDECRDEWADMSVNIARDVHEIKKEYGLIFRGIEEVIDNKLHDSGMNFKDVVKILKDSMLIQASSEGDNISLEFNISENFYTDKHYQLMSIFRNLIMNSMEAIGPRDNGKIVFRHTTDSENHIFSICDNGCGIKTEDSENIFSAGFSTKINYETGQINRGLGLSLVKDIVEKQLGGKIEVNSKHSQGTEFNITILKQILNV